MMEKGIRYLLMFLLTVPATIVCVGVTSTNFWYGVWMLWSYACIGFLGHVVSQGRLIDLQDQALTVLRGEAVRCDHGRTSGQYCVACVDVVPTLSGYRPWWAELLKRSK